MVTAPLALIAFSFLHGSFSWAETQHLHVASNEEWIAHLSNIKERWLVIHVAGVFWFPLLGLTVWFGPNGFSGWRGSSRSLTDD